MSACYFYTNNHTETQLMRTEVNEKNGTQSVLVCVWLSCCCHPAHSVADKIIQHELLMSWIIARLHGYSASVYGLLLHWKWEMRVVR